MSTLFLYALFFISCSVFLVESHQFRVGGKCGWTTNPRESYNLWAGRNRFQVNDTLYFKYNKNTDSVVIVDEEDYKNCNTTRALGKLEGGESVFKFDHSGPFFFITSNYTNCQKGQKLIVVVLAIRSPPSPHVPTPSPPRPTPSYPPIPSPSSGISPIPAPSEYSPPARSAGVAVAEQLTGVLTAVCVVLGFSLISG